MLMLKRPAVRIWLLLTLSLATLFITAGQAKKGTLIFGEEHLLTLIYDMPEELRLMFLILTMLGSLWVMSIILSVLLIKERFDIALRVIISGFSALAITALAKEFIGRPRPGLLTDIFQRELLVFGYGYPSGHTALATSVVLILGAYLPKSRRAIVPIWIGVVAVSRLYLGVHAPLDIVGGFVIGFMVATCVLLVLPPHKIVPGLRVAKKRKHA